MWLSSLPVRTLVVRIVASPLPTKDIENCRMWPPSGLVIATARQALGDLADFASIVGRERHDGLAAQVGNVG